MEEHKGNGKGNGGNGGGMHEDFVGAQYLIDVAELRQTVQELGEKLANADDHNNRVKKICEALEVANVKREVIEAALASEFGKPKGLRRRRGPNRKSSKPTEVESLILSVMTSEPMNKTSIFSAANVTPEQETKNMLSAMQRFGWVDNVGGKGRAAGWVLTEAGAELVDASA